MKVRLSSYGNYSGNYGAHSMVLTLGTLTLFFSYSTIVAFDDGNGTKVVQNRWGSTTGKHLNAIDGGYKQNRLTREAFDEALEQVLKNHNLEV